MDDAWWENIAPSEDPRVDMRAMVRTWAYHNLPVCTAPKWWEDDEEEDEDDESDDDDKQAQGRQATFVIDETKYSWLGSPTVPDMPTMVVVNPSLKGDELLPGPPCPPRFLCSESCTCHLYYNFAGQHLTSCVYNQKK